MTSHTNELGTNVLARLTLIALLGGFVGGALVTKLENRTTTGPLNTVEERRFVEESDSIEAIKKAVPGVISIVATKDLQIFQQQPMDPFMFFFPGRIPQQQPQEEQAPQFKREKVSGGTGFILQEDGLAVTNKHVVSDLGADYSALTKDGKEFDVEVISRDPVNDLAVIQLYEKTTDADNRKTGEKKDFGAKASRMPTIRLGDSTKLQVGQRVLAIGNARGEYENSVTSGIVSAVGREISASEQRGGPSELLSGLIQTDAAINFGNSGGPLVNLNGEVIGINTAIDASAQGVGFAIPISQVIPVLESVKKFGRIVRPILGVQHIILSKEKAAELKLNGVEYGALVTGNRAQKNFGVLPGSPAEKAGLRLDDVILEVDGEKITEANTLQTIIQKHVPGDVLKLKVWRAGSTLEVSLTLDERKEP